MLLGPIGTAIISVIVFRKDGCPTSLTLPLTSRKDGCPTPCPIPPMRLVLDLLRGLAPIHPAEVPAGEDEQAKDDAVVGEGDEAVAGDKG